MLFINSSVAGEYTWVPRGDDPMPCEGPAGSDVDLESRTNLLESPDTTIVANLPDNVDELKQKKKKRKMKKVTEKTSPHSRNSAKRDIS